MNQGNWIDYCLSKNLTNNTIRYMRFVKDFDLQTSEVLFECKDGVCAELKRGSDKIDMLRLRAFLALVNSLFIDKAWNFRFILQLCDGMLNQEREFTRLCFSCKYDSNHISIPDPHLFMKQIQQLSKELLLRDCDFANKINKAIFRGSDTGPLMSSMLNQRVDFCHRHVGSKFIDAKISMFYFFNENLLRAANVEIKHVAGPYRSVSDQLQYKFVITINGNTASWDRIPLFGPSNSLVVGLRSIPELEEWCWYYPYMYLVGALPLFETEDELMSLISEEENVVNFKRIQKQFCDKLVQYSTHQEYLFKLFTSYNQLYNS